MIQINIIIAATTWDKIRVHSFHGQTEAPAKMSIFFEFITIALCILIIKKQKYLSKGPT